MPAVRKLSTSPGRYPLAPPLFSWPFLLDYFRPNLRPDFVESFRGSLRWGKAPLAVQSPSPNPPDLFSDSHPVQAIEISVFRLSPVFHPRTFFEKVLPGADSFCRFS